MASDAGFSAAVALAVDDAGLPDALRPVEQLDLLGEVDVPLAEYRRRGRPAGARNKRTGEIRDWLLSSYTHPLEVLAATASMETGRLATELSCTRAEAHDRRIKAAVELAPYLESRMPVAVNVDARGTIALTIERWHGEGAADGQVIQIGGFERSISMIDAGAEVVEEQGLSE